MYINIKTFLIELGLFYLKKALTIQLCYISYDMNIFATHPWEFDVLWHP